MGEFGGQIGPDNILGQLFAHDPRTHHQHIPVVVLDALMPGVRIVADAGANADQFIGGHAGANAAAANQHAAFGAAVQNSAADGFGKIRIVRRILVECADVQNFVSQGAQKVPHGIFQLETCVIGTNDDFHGASPAQQLFCGRNDLFRPKPKFLQQIFQWCLRTKTVHPDGFALRTNVAVPAKRRSHLDGNARSNRGRQNTFLVGSVLPFEQIP